MILITWHPLLLANNLLHLLAFRAAINWWKLLRNHACVYLGAIRLRNVCISVFGSHLSWNESFHRGRCIGDTLREVSDRSWVNVKPLTQLRWMPVVVTVAVYCVCVHVLLLACIKRVGLLVHLLHIAVNLGAFLNLIILISCLLGFRFLAIVSTVLGLALLLHRACMLDVGRTNERRVSVHSVAAARDWLVRAQRLVLRCVVLCVG